MADNRNVPDSLTDLDNLDLDFEQSNNQNDFDNLLGQEAQSGQFALDDSDFDALLADTGGGGNAPAGGVQQARLQRPQQQQIMAQNMPRTMPQSIPESMPQQHQDLVDDLDPLKSMSINEVDLHDPLIHQSIRNSNARTQAANANSTIGGRLVGQAASMGNQQIVQNNLVAQNNGMIAPQQVPAPQPVGGAGGVQVGGGGGGAMPNDLEAQKKFLLNKLKQVQIQKEKLAQSNGLAGAGGLQQTTPYPTPQQQAQNRKQPLVASANTVGSIKPTESALSSFLRGSRKSTTLEAGSPPAPAPEEPASLLSSHVKNAPQAASIFNHAPMNVGNNNSFGMGMGNQQGSMISQRLGRSGSGRNLMRAGSGQNLMGGSQNAGNASWGTGAESLQPTSTGGYARSGIIRKNASEGALNHSLMRAKRSSASRENLSYMKRTNSGRNMLGSSENLQSMMPVRRTNYSKHSLGRSASRSQPSLNLMTSRPSPKYQQNAQW